MSATTERKRDPVRQAVARVREADQRLLVSEPPARPPRKRKPKPLRRVDALGSIPFLAAEQGRFIAIDRGLPPPSDSLLDMHPDKVVQTRSRPAIRGAAAIVASYQEHGFTFELVPGGFTYRTPAGGAVREARDAIRTLAPLIGPYLATGHPPPCAWDCGQEAVTLLEPGDTLACASHAELPDDKAKVEYERVLPSTRDRMRQYFERWTKGY